MNFQDYNSDHCPQVYNAQWQTTALRTRVHKYHILYYLAPDHFSHHNPTGSLQAVSWTWHAISCLSACCYLSLEYPSPPYLLANLFSPFKIPSSETFSGEFSLACLQHLKVLGASLLSSQNTLETNQSQHLPNYNLIKFIGLSIPLILNFLKVGDHFHICITATITKT